MAITDLHDEPRTYIDKVVDRELAAGDLADGQPEVYEELRVVARELARVREHLARQERAVDRIRAAERQRLAALLRSKADELRTFAPDGITAEMLAFILTIDHASPTTA